MQLLGYTQCVILKIRQKSSNVPQGCRTGTGHDAGVCVLCIKTKIISEREKIKPRKDMFEPDKVAMPASHTIPEESNSSPTNNNQETHSTCRQNLAAVV